MFSSQRCRWDGCPAGASCAGITPGYGHPMCWLEIPWGRWLGLSCCLCCLGCTVAQCRCHQSLDAESTRMHVQLMTF